jgi:amidase
MPEESKARSGITRRDALKLGVAAGAAAGVAAVAGTTAQAAAPTNLNEATIAQLQSNMHSGGLTSSHLVDYYLARIRTLDQDGPGVNSVLEINPEAREIARALDEERRRKGPRGPLHGIPVLLKDNIDTGDRMQTAAGSLALVGRPALRDSTVAKNLRAAGAVILGKTNLSEWANIRSTSSSSGWSGRGGQCNNPYIIDFNPCGSSSGSAAAVSANFTSVSIGSETDGSIVCPANVSGVVGLKPTIGLVSRAGVVPISHTQDSAGPHGRTVADVAVVLGAIQSKTSDGRDAATAGVPLGWANTGRTRPTNIPSDYTQFLDPAGLQGARLGLWAAGSANASPKEQAAFLAAQDAMTKAGATLVTFDFDHASDINSGNAEFLVLLYDLKLDLANYLKDRTGVPIHNLADAIAFNKAHAAAEMPWFGQEIFEIAQAMDTSSPDAPQPQFGGMTYNQALALDQLIGATEGIDKVLKDHHLDAIVAATANIGWATDLVNGDRPGGFGASTPPAIVGYPIISVPSALIKGLPVGVSFFAGAFSEPTLIKLASGFEHVMQARREPKFIREIGLNPQGNPDDQGGGDGGNHQNPPDLSKRPAMI